MAHLLLPRHNTQEEFLICFFSFNRSKPRLSIFISRDLAQVLSEPENLMGGREGGGVLHSCWAQRGKRVGGVVLTVMQSIMGPRMIHQIFLFLLFPQHLRQRVGSGRLTVETVKTPSSLEGSLGVGREDSNPFLLGWYCWFFFFFWWTRKVVFMLTACSVSFYIFFPMFVQT